MTLDFDRLAHAVREARTARAWRQQDLADAAGVGLSSVQNVEAGRAFTRLPGSLRKIETALGWEAGAALAVLRGGEPTPRRDLPDSTSGAHAEAPADARASVVAQLPHALRLMLQGGEVVDYDLITFPGDDGPSAFMVLAHESTYADEDSALELRKRLREFRRIAEKVRKEVTDLADPHTPPNAQDRQQ